MKTLKMISILVSYLVISSTASAGDLQVISPNRIDIIAKKSKIVATQIEQTAEGKNLLLIATNNVFCRVPEQLLKKNDLTFKQVEEIANNPISSISCIPEDGASVTKTLFIILDKN